MTFFAVNERGLSMSMITFEGQHYCCQQDETVLECLTRHGLLIPSGCKNGVCQTCLSKAVKGNPGAESQKGLKDTLVAQGYFLACVCKPEEDIEMAVANVATHDIGVTLVEKDILNESVVRLRLRCDDAMDYIAGQFVNVKHPETELVRSYSLASLPSDDALELHVKRVPDGRMSGYLHDQVAVGDRFTLTGAAGDCFYTDKDLQQPLLMVAVGTGLAPMYGIVRDALKQGHVGEIHIYHASLAKQGLYYIDEMNLLAKQHDQVHYIPCVLHGDAPAGGQQGDIQHIVQSSFPSLRDWRVYVCGDPAIVNGLKQTCFLAGAAMADIYSDPFVFSEK